jgi:hypothetical protein
MNTKFLPAPGYPSFLSRLCLFIAPFSLQSTSRKFATEAQLPAFMHRDEHRLVLRLL